MRPLPEGVESGLTNIWEGLAVLGHGASCARGTVGRIGLVSFHVVAQEPDLCGWLVVRSGVKETLSRFQTNFFLRAHSLGFFFFRDLPSYESFIQGEHT